MHPRALWIQNGADFVRKRFSLFGRKIQQRQAGYDRTDTFNGGVAALQQTIQLPRVAGDDLGAGKTFTEQARELGVSFDSHQPVLTQPMFEQGLGDGAGPGAEFEHIGFGIRRQPMRHGGGQFSGTGNHRAGPLRIGKPFLQKQGCVR